MRDNPQNGTVSCLRTTEFLRNAFYNCLNLNLNDLRYASNIKPELEGYSSDYYQNSC